MVAYGSQGIWYFHYNDNVWDPKDEKPGPLYETAKECNRYVQAIGPKVLGHRGLGAFHTPGPELAQGALTPGKGKLIERMSDGLLAGFLVPENEFFGEQPDLVMIVDKRTVTPNEAEPGERRVSVTFEPDVEAMTVYERDGAPVRRELPASHRLSLTLKAGEGVLIGL
jgi:hypothetical protein